MKLQNTMHRMKWMHQPENNFATLGKRMFLTAFFLPLCLVQPARAAEFTIKPYLQEPSSTEMSVLWEMDSLAECTVSYAQGTEAPKVVTVKEPVKTPEKYVAPAHLYSVKLKDLTPDTKYTYTVSIGDKTANGTFTTFSKKSDTFTYIAYGDSRSNPDIHKSLAANFIRHNPKFILHSGDFVVNGRDRESWKKEFFDPLDGVISHVPLFAAYGNHEKDGVMLDFYFLPSSDELRYTFDYGNSHFTIVKNQDEEGLAWLDKELGAANATWKFVVHHYPCFNVGGKSVGKAQDTMPPILRKHKVDVTFAGDSHIYERLHPLVPLAEPKAHPITYIVSGGGGAPKYGTGQSPAIAKTDNMSHFIVVKVKPESVTMEVRGVDDKLYESFTINKKDGQYDREYLASVQPEELVKLHLLLYGNVKGKFGRLDLHLSSPPKPGEVLDVNCIYTGPVLTPQLPGNLVLSEESKANYSMEPAEIPLTVGSPNAGKISFKVKPKGEVKIVKDELQPPLFITYNTKVGSTDLPIRRRVMPSAQKARGEPRESE